MPKFYLEGWPVMTLHTVLIFLLHTCVYCLHHDHEVTVWYRSRILMNCGNNRIKSVQEAMVQFCSYTVPYRTYICTTHIVPGPVSCDDIAFACVIVEFSKSTYIKLQPKTKQDASESNSSNSVLTKKLHSALLLLRGQAVLV